MNNINYIDLAKENIDIEMVINLCGDSIQNGYVNTCIFTNHKKSNKMKISRDGTYCKCYNCNKSVDVVGYWAQHNMITQYDAGKDLCSRFNLIPSCGSMNHKENKQSRVFKKQPETVKTILDNHKKYMKENDIASVEVRHFIYSIFKEACEEYNGFTLIEEHKDSLLNERYLDEVEIKEDDLFTFPKVKEIYEKYDTNKIKAIKYRYNNEVSDKIISIMERKIMEKGKTIDLLKNVPGFQYDKKLEKYSVNLKYNCFAIPVKENNKIIAIHLRRDNLPKDKMDEEFVKYFWFTSKKNYNIEERYTSIASPGTPVIIVYPKKVKNKRIFVTEGYFKAKKIAKTYDSIAISVQGVWSWRMVIVAMENLKSNIEVEEVVIAFDADSKCNNSVKQASKYLANILEKDNKNVSYAIWKLDFGKGIDDVINNGYKNDIYKYKKNTWEYKCDIIENYLKSKFNKEINEMSDEEKNIWVDEFQKLEIYTNEELKKILRYNKKS